jgi:preprotein translocase subunit YajC
MKKIVATLLSLPVSLFAADQNTAPSAEHGLTQTLVMVGLALVFFYFILWRPEQKRRKTMEALRTSMKKGDRVIAMGMVGHISKIKDDTVIVKTGDAEVEFLKAAISEVQDGSKAEAKEG